MKRVSVCESRLVSINLKITTFICLIILMVQSAWAASAAQQLAAKLAKLDNWQAHFEQQLIGSERAALFDKQHGQVWIKQPGYLKWQTSEPFKQTILIRGREVTVYDPELEQAIVRKEENSYNSAFLLLSEPQKTLLEEKVFRTERFSAKNQTRFVLTPTQPAEYRLVQIFYDKDKLTSILIELPDQKLHISFTKAATKPLPKQLFKLNLPPDTEIIRDQ